MGWLPHPFLSLLLAVSWLLLQQSVAPAQLLWAVVLALAIPRIAHALIGQPTRPRAWAVALRLTGVVLWDIVVSNFVVARIVLNPWSRPRPAWVPVALEARHPTAISLLATIITTTPGTVSCVVDDDRQLILVHALDCEDPAGMASDIKQRYEQPLRQIFDPPEAGR
jgi:multicomponent K+:H+ antiporter subunit E